ncbi:redox-sensitive transcriptional activator SoxR [Salinimonas marina]|uniref:Redox-sensitive transcriptional activator SoxR n=1 Tax=Salinimonas marina TaxID=2785918 RepID=A0A7S9DVA4_9ALTE|nr:redox-sensitive transcriptional activator SoxR [Salinimonas marina]QPG04584.1 redox-sensitive transcriptional activator SoxR [Salinimonas marina]
MQNMSVGQVARRTGVAVSTLHFYEQKGLIHASRNAGNQRRFGRDAIRRVSLIKAAQQLGISLEEIAQAFAPLPDFAAPSAKQWQAMASGWQVQLDARIEKLTRLRKSLTGCIGCGCLSMANCPLYNPDDNLAAQGPGPVILNRTRKS